MVFPQSAYRILIAGSLIIMLYTPLVKADTSRLTTPKSGYFMFSFKTPAAEIQPPLQAVNSMVSTYQPDNQVPFFTRPVTVIRDGQQLDFQIEPFLNPENRSMIAVSEIERLFSWQPEFADSSQVVYFRNNQQISFRVPQQYYCVDDQIINMDTCAIKVDNQLFLPLRFVCQEMGYKVWFDPREAKVYVNNPDYLKDDPQIELPDEALAFNPPANLPRWGRLLETPELAVIWKDYNVLGGYYTTLINSPAGRTNNIKLACSFINGKLLMPGEVFSFNQTVGIRSSQKGYQSAPIFVGNQVVPGIGGGICQVSSTLYNMSLDTELPIVERYPHSLKVVYVPESRDATVSWGGADLKFINNKTHPIRILTQVFGPYVMAAVIDAR